MILRGLIRSALIPDPVQPDCQKIIKEALCYPVSGSQGALFIIVNVIIILTLLNQRLYNRVCRIIAKKTFAVFFGSKSLDY